jgi:hypothetical protein
MDGYFNLVVASRQCIVNFLPTTHREHKVI